MDKDNNQMKHKVITLAHKPLIVYVITALMAATSLLYFYVTYEDYQELLQSSSSSADNKDTAALGSRYTSNKKRNDIFPYSCYFLYSHHYMDAKSKTQ